MAFKTEYSYFYYQLISLSLSIVQTSFQEYINKILAKKLDVFVIVYLNNILIYTNKADKVKVV